MTQGLAVSDVVQVTVALSPAATSTRNFGAGLVIGNSAVMSLAETLRVYTSLTAVATDFTVLAPEYLAAQTFFSASPPPSLLYVGRLGTTETLAAATARLAAASSDWYCLMPANPALGDTDILATAQYIEGASPSRILAATTQEAAALVAATNTDLASTLQGATLTRTFAQYSSSNPYAAGALFGRIATVNYNAGNTALTLKFQIQPGIAAETLSETQAQALLGKRCNMFVNFQNGAAIVQEGVMCSSYYIDERVGLDWLQNALQVAGFNALYGAGTKIPQTDAGMNILATAYEGIMDQGVTNGLGAPGIWTGPAFGALVSGQMLTKGFYCYMPPIATQSAADRAARKAVVAQIAFKLAGAVHSSNVVVSVVR